MYDIRPFDWVMLIVELLMLILIAVEVLPLIYSRLQANRRRKVLFGLLTRGQQILNQAPSTFDAAPVHGWGQRVDAWTVEVANVLKTYSENAVASFNHQSQIGMPHHQIATGAWPHYDKITSRAENLHNIIEKPEIYY